MNNTLKFIDDLNINPNSHIIVGCSGGPDSMCLLSILYKKNFKVVCAHVNHNIRKESTDEYQFIENFCHKNKIIFEGLELPKGMIGNESIYRKERYKFYKRLADKYKTNLIMTAHHGDDLIETVLMRITRGSNIKGYLGFPKSYMEGKYQIVKPLIYMTKEEIIAYNKDNDIPYVLDYTNDEDNYTRNRYRHNVLKFLKQEDSSVHLKYLKYNEELESISNYISRVVENALKNNFDDGVIDIKKFILEDPLIQKKELEYILKGIYENDIDRINDSHTKKILELLKTGKNFKYNLPLEWIVEREYNFLSFKKDNIEEDYNYELKDEVHIRNYGVIKVVSESLDNSNYITRLSSEKVCLPLYVRNKKDGDIIEVKNLNGSKKVKKIFIDEKIKPSERRQYPVVVDALDRIVWIPGVKKSKFDIKKDEKCDIILKYIKKEGKD